MQRTRMIGRLLLAATTCLVVGGCTIPLFEHPLETPDAATIPQELFGVYKQTAGPDNVSHHVHVGPAEGDAPAGVFRFRSISQAMDRSTPPKATRGFAIATRVGEFHIMQIPVFSPNKRDSEPQIDRDSWNESEIAGYIMMRLRVHRDGIEMSCVDSLFVESAIGDGNVAGTVERTETKHVTTVPNEDGELVATTISETKTDSIMVTANPHSLLSFVRKNVDAGLFSHSPTEFHRNN